MPRYRVYAPLVATKYLGEYEASTEDEAIEMALNSDEADGVGLCRQCSDRVGDSKMEIDDSKAVAEIVE